MDTPGSMGEHRLQKKYKTDQRARAFYKNQTLDHLNARMRDFIGRQEMVFLATADAQGHCDSSFRAGPRGFVLVLSEKVLAYPEYRGNGVMASLANITENPHIGLFFADFFESTIGLHINGRAKIAEKTDSERHGLPGGDSSVKPAPERWVLVEVEEAYIHCSKHVPLLRKIEKAIHWGTDDPNHKGGDYFGTKKPP